MPAATAASDWWTHIRVSDVAKARAGVENFINAPGEPTLEACDEFTRSFCLWVLCAGRAALDYVRRQVETLHAERSVLLVQDHTKLALFSKVWAARLEAIAARIGSSVGMLPYPWRQDASELADALTALLQRAMDEVIRITISIGIPCPLELP
jgi:hypothetical protein